MYKYTKERPECCMGKKENKGYFSKIQQDVKKEKKRKASKISLLES